MNLLDVLDIRNKPCAICGRGDLVIRLYDPELGGMCQECGELDAWAETRLVMTKGICKPGQANNR